MRATSRRCGWPNGQRALGQGGDGQAVPRGDHLVVPAGADPLLARGQQRPPDAVKTAGVGWLGASLQDRGAALEGPGLGDAEGPRRELAVLRAEDRVQLGGPPDVELPLFALAVGVQRGGQAAGGGAHVVHHPRARLKRHPAAQLGAGGAPQVQVDPGQQRVVVEHLLEVRHHPGGVRRVPGETAAAAGRTGRRGPWPRRCPRPSAARRAPRSAGGSGAGTPAPSTAGTSARGRTRPRPRRSRARARSPRRP